jgi:hypothetical protein
LSSIKPGKIAAGSIFWFLRVVAQLQGAIGLWYSNKEEQRAQATTI